MEKSLFFDAVLDKETGKYDRVYKAKDFASYFNKLIGNGVFNKKSSNLQVMANAENMTVTVKPGSAWINGYMYDLSEDFKVELERETGTFDRIDRIAVRFDQSKRAINLVVIKGNPSNDPQVPQIQRNELMFDLVLADIKISGGGINITQKDITDKRFDSEVCGIVTGLVEQVDVSTLFKEYEDWVHGHMENSDKEYQEWLEGMESDVDGRITAVETNYEEWSAARLKEFNEKSDELQGGFEKWSTETQATTKEMIEQAELKYNEWFDTMTSEASAEFTEWFESIKDKIDEDEVLSVVNDVITLEKQMVEVQTGLKELEEIVGEGVDLSEIEAKLETIDSNLLSLSESITEVESNVVGVQGEVDDIQIELKSIDSFLTVMESVTSQLREDVDALKSTVTSLDSKVETIEDKINTLPEDIADKPYVDDQIQTNIYNNKVILAEAITEKGQESTADDSFVEMADKIRAIESGGGGVNIPAPAIGGQFRKGASKLIAKVDWHRDWLEELGVSSRDLTVRIGIPNPNPYTSSGIKWGHRLINVNPERGTMLELEFVEFSQLLSAYGDMAVPCIMEIKHDNNEFPPVYFNYTLPVID